MNIANKITILRILLVPFFVYFLINNKYIEAFILFFIASYTDRLDGKLARKYNQVTNFGKFADPLADKALVMSAFVYFVEIGEVSSVALIIMLIREFTVMSVRLVAAGNSRVISANYGGKAKTVSQILTIFLIMTLLVMKMFESSMVNNYLILIKDLFVWSSVALSCISGIIYLYRNHIFIKNAI